MIFAYLSSKFLFTSIYRFSTFYEGTMSYWGSTELHGEELWALDWKNSSRFNLCQYWVCRSLDFNGFQCGRLGASVYPSLRAAIFFIRSLSRFLEEVLYKYPEYLLNIHQQGSQMVKLTFLILKIKNKSCLVPESICCPLTWFREVHFSQCCPANCPASQPSGSQCSVTWCKTGQGRTLPLLPSFLLPPRLGSTRFRWHASGPNFSARDLFPWSIKKLGIMPANWL